ncbi:MAG: sodium-dependent bicarbonate transport family permease [Chloroflexota bacterium]
MSEMLELMRINLLSPMVLAFVLGIIVAAVKSDLRLPDSIMQAISVYLLFSIGLEGGYDLARAPLFSFFGPALVAVVLGALIPVAAYLALTTFGRLDASNAIAIGIHYGGVSSVSLSAGIAFLNELGVDFEGFLPTLYVVMELPAFMVALLLVAWRIGADTQSLGNVARVALTGKTVILLGGGVVIGLLSGDAGEALMEPFFFDLFPGILTLFLLQMGTVVAERFDELQNVNFFVIFYAIVGPMIHGFAAVFLGTLTGLSVGGAFILGTIASSASFISAPVVVSANIPKANPGIHMTTALVITFPFTLTLGLPLTYEFALWMSRIGIGAG